MDSRIKKCLSKLILNSSQEKKDPGQIKYFLQAVDEILATQPEEDCRKNVLETIGVLKKDFPKDADYIERQFKSLCEKHKKDFFKELKNN